MTAPIALTLWALACGPVDPVYPVPGVAWSYEPAIRRAAAQAKLPMGVSMALPGVETRFDHRKVSHRQARGLFQIMKRDQVYLVGRYLDTSRFNWRDPEQSATLGLLYLADLKKRFRGQLPEGIIAYNMGPTARASGRPLPKETLEYFPRVLFGVWR